MRGWETEACGRAYNPLNESGASRRVEYGGDRVGSLPRRLLADDEEDHRVHGGLVSTS